MMCQGWSTSLFQASQQWPTRSSPDWKMRFESQLSRMNCQMFSTGMARTAPWFGTFRRQRHDGDVVRHRQLGRQVPPGLVDQKHRVRAGRHRERDLS